MTRTLLLILALAACGAPVDEPVDEPDAGPVETPDAGEIMADAGDAPDAGACVPWTDETACADHRAECGRISKYDRCLDEIRQFECGACDDGYRCSGSYRCLPL